MNAVGLSSYLWYILIKMASLFSLRIHKAIDIWIPLEQGEVLCKLVANKTDISEFDECLTVHRR